MRPSAVNPPGGDAPEPARDLAYLFPLFMYIICQRS
jgi:hypothetical protein